MTNFVKVRASVNNDKRVLTEKGTSYRKGTAVLASRLLNDLVSSNHDLNNNEKLSRPQLRRLVKIKYRLDNERADDVAKFVHVHLRSEQDEQRLADVYAEVDAYLNG